MCTIRTLSVQIPITPFCRVFRGRSAPNAALLGDEIYCDHVHFTDAVRAQQAAYIAGWLQAWWDQRSTRQR